jgi:beta-phosphoglucomutase
MPLHGCIGAIDGVRTATPDSHSQAWQQRADEGGLPCERDRNEALRGVSRRPSLAVRFAGRVSPEAQMREMMERTHRSSQALLTQVTPDDRLPGAHGLLQALRAAGQQIALGSASKNAREVVQRLHIASCIDARADGYSVVRPKPAPDLSSVTLPVLLQRLALAHAGGH